MQFVAKEREEDLLKQVEDALLFKKTAYAGCLELHMKEFYLNRVQVCPTSTDSVPLIHRRVREIQSVVMTEQFLTECMDWQIHRNIVAWRLQWQRTKSDAKQTSLLRKWLEPAPTPRSCIEGA